MPDFPLIAARAFNTPLLIHEGKAAAFAAAFAPRLFGAPVIIEGARAVDHQAGQRPLMGELGDPLQTRVDDREAFYRVGSIAVIPIEGTLVHKGKWVGQSSGETSYEGIQRQVHAARRDPQIRGVVFEVDSYGGEVSGAFDAAEAIYELSLEKPTISIFTDFGFSAGYLLGCAARQVVLPSAGGAGSIGVVGMHVDFSAFLDKAGIKVTIISAGRHKADGNPYEALPAEVAAKWKAETEAVRRLFAGAVARYRGARASFDQVMATEADCFRGEEAVRAGLADAVGRPSEAFEAFRNEVEGRALPQLKGAAA